MLGTARQFFSHGKICLLFLGGLVGLIVWLFAMPSEESRVRKVFERASGLLEKTGTEPVFAAAAKARDLAALVLPGTRLDIPDWDVSAILGGDQFSRQIALARSQSQFIKVAFEELSVVFADEDTALVHANVLFTGTSYLYGFSGHDRCELSATLKRDPSSGDWRFSAITIKPVVGKDPDLE